MFRLFTSYDLSKGMLRGRLRASGDEEDIKFWFDNIPEWTVYVYITLLGDA